MSLLSKTKKICRQYSIKPWRQMGQNFLVDKNVLDKIIESGNLSKKDVILEIGAGLGTLTEKLAIKTKKVYAIEIDNKIVDVLREKLKGYKNIQIIKKDARKLNIVNWKDIKDYKLIANLPYNITSFILRKFLSTKQKPKLIILMVQEEVAERIIAQPPQMSILSVSVQFYGIPEIIMKVSKKSFWPKPKVNSAILKITPHKQFFSKSRIFQDRFFRIVRLGFSNKRKYLLNNLTRCATINGRKELKKTGDYHRQKEKILKIFYKLDLSPKKRAQELSIENWLKITQELKI